MSASVSGPKKTGSKTALRSVPTLKNRESVHDDKENIQRTTKKTKTGNLNKKFRWPGSNYHIMFQRYTKVFVHNIRAWLHKESIYKQNCFLYKEEILCYCYFPSELPNNWAITVLKMLVNVKINNNFRKRTISGEFWKRFQKQGGKERWM